MTNKIIKYFSLFAGIGGFDLAMPQNCECVGYSEINKYAIKIFEKHFPNIKNYGDATKIITSELPEFDLLVAGFPCQPFSIAGKRKGFQDTRGTLFFEIARVLRDKRPRYFLLENVKGLLSHEAGKTFQTILGVLSNIGYLLQWEVLNSKNFGVPQNRERVFIIGHLRGESRPKVFPIGESNRVFKKESEQEVICSTITSRYYKRGKTDPYIKCMFETERDTHGVYDGQKIRRLTPVECERLQGFPDNWTKEGISDTQRYKCLGNAVTVNVVRTIMERLLA